MLNVLVSRFVDAARRFRSDRRGNVAMIFGIAAIPTVLAVGGFVDYERGSLARAQMQDALDATALALHTDAATMTQSQMNDFATKYFAANFNNIDAFNVVVTPNYDKGGPTVTVRVGRVLGAWSESTVTWNTRPAYAWAGEAKITSGTESRLDVTSIVKSAVAEGASDVSVVLQPSASAPSTDNVFIDAKEKVGGVPTKLVVEWTAGAPAQNQ